MSIPDEAFEAAAMAVMTEMLERPGSDGYVDGHREYARAALEAAAPYLMAEAAVEAAVSAVARNYGYAGTPANTILWARIAVDVRAALEAAAPILLSPDS
jgi:hypothetical protein